MILSLKDDHDNDDDDDGDGDGEDDADDDEDDDDDQLGEWNQMGVFAVTQQFPTSFTNNQERTSLLLKRCFNFTNNST